jgi:alpha-D-ribose 1-methylphosphonate 5-triphosphate synthase subunit PhnG
MHSKNVRPRVLRPKAMLMSTHTTLPPGAAERRDVMSVLVRATRDELTAPLAQYWPDLAVRILRSPETGLVMLRGRIGGDGAPFNVGEATMSRAVIELETGERGYGQVLGRDSEHARLAAIIEALAQKQDAAQTVERVVLAPIRARLKQEKAQIRAQTAATRVDFFTLVRGED